MENPYHKQTRKTFNISITEVVLAAVKQTQILKKKQKQSFTTKFSDKRKNFDSFTNINVYNFSSVLVSLKS